MDIVEKQEKKNVQDVKTFATVQLIANVDIIKPIAITVFFWAEEAVRTCMRAEKY